jgi:D-lactate dehydrogenase (cytochrome)
MIQLGVPIARCELLDANTVRMVNAHSKLGLRENAMLLMEFHGSPGEREGAGRDGAGDRRRHLAAQAFEWATTPEERTRLWTARHNAYFRGDPEQARAAAPSAPTPACRSAELADCLLDSVAEADASGMPYFLVGHVGDGNFHFGYLIDPNNARRARGWPKR